MRCTQFIGLPNDAEDYLINLRESSEGEEIFGMFLEVAHVCNHFYDDKGNLVYKEVLQAEPWSSGPVIFTKLVDPNGIDVCTHLQEEIDNA